MNVYPPNDYRSYLVHHGIKGMRWGIQNGPPYPLSLETHSMVISGSKSTGSKEVGKSDKATSDRKSSDKTELYAYALSLGVSLATLNPVGLAATIARGGQAIHASSKTKKAEKIRSESKIDKKTGYHLKSRAFTKEEDMKAVNPSFHNFDRNTKNNCMLCTTAYDMRRRGYEVSAEKAKVGYKPSDAAKWYTGAKLVDSVKVGETFGEKFKAGLKGSLGVNLSVTKKVQSDLLKQGEGARGNLIMLWDASGAGHSVVYEVGNGKVVLRDCQTNRVYRNPGGLLNKAVAASYVRLDNVQPNYVQMKKDGVIR